MEEQWYADRCRLRELLRSHPDWSHRQFAAELGRSRGWIKKWTRRLRDAEPADDTVLHGQSRARRHPPPARDPAVVARILEIRDHPPANLQRVPGPTAILYYLHRDAELAARGARLARSTRTIWRVLTQHGRIAGRRPRDHQPVDRPPPLAVWQVDFKDVSTVPADPDGKRQHVVEAFHTVDTGTSILLNAQVRADFTAETALAAVAQTLQAYGLPQRISVDRDPRFVGSPSGRDFPAPFRRFLLCLGIEAEVSPPQRPDKQAFVERYHRTYEQECLRVCRPATEEQAREHTAAFAQHYNHERPNQALSCGNRPPRAAFPSLPVLPPVPERVDPDRWVQAIDGQRYVRKVKQDGTVLVADQRYYVQRALAGQYVVLQVDATARALVAAHRQRVIRRVPLKGLHGEPLAFAEFLELMQQAARSDWRAGRWRRRPAVA
jgi:hypothetical protein